MKDKQITALLIKVGEKPKRITMENSLKAFQQAVGGYIEFYPIDNGKAAAILDEEGKLKGYEGNRRIGKEIIAGDFLIVGDNGLGECVSLTDNQVKQYSEQFGEPESYTAEQVEENILIEIIPSHSVLGQTLTPEEFQSFIDPRPIPFPKKNNDKTR